MQAGLTFLSTQPPKPVLRACEKIAVCLNQSAPQRSSARSEDGWPAAAIRLRNKTPISPRADLAVGPVRSRAGASVFPAGLGGLSTHGQPSAISASRLPAKNTACMSSNQMLLTPQARLECGKTHAPYQGRRTHNSARFLTAPQALRAAV
jgi:hypothetical protein